MIQIGGMTPFTTIDYPGKLAAVLFLRGCPFRCAYCSNPHLIAPGDGEYDADKVLDFLKTRVGKLDAVVFSGGEALMQDAAAIDYMRAVRGLGFLIGLHTNGFYPDVLGGALDTIDWTGLDFKAAPEKYAALTGDKMAYDKMLGTLDLLVQGGKDFEVRVTCDPRFVTKNDLLEIAKLAADRGARKFAVQKYIPHNEKITTESDRAQFFMDEKLRSEIENLFESVAWRE